jgi:hypothetical protein
MESTLETLRVSRERACEALGEEALAYAERGWAVFPCLVRGKEPACRRGFKEAGTNPATIARWWQRTPYNVAIATGAASGVFVLDVDGPDGVASLADLERTHGPLTTTATSTTGAGRHIWFATSVPIQCSAGRVGPGLDIRGDGGYVIAPPSIHPTGKIYTWANPGPVIEAPPWLVDLTRKRPPAPISVRAMASIARPGGYGQAALKYELDALAQTPRGSRNHRLNRASFSLHQLVAGGELGAGDVEAGLLAIPLTLAGF